MPNMRIVYDNAAKRAVVTADSTIGNLVASNLLTDIKGEVWRGSNSTPRSIALSWTDSETVSCVALPFCSLSPTATIRVKGYSDSGFLSMVLDTGYVLAAPASLNSLDNAWGILPLGVNAYSYGGAATAAVYFLPATVKSMTIEITDLDNPLGYVEAGCLVVGAYWSPVYNVQYGEVQVEASDSSRHERSDSGDLYTDRGVLFKSMTISLQRMPAPDRDAVWRIMRGNGMFKPVFVSVAPENYDASEEQIYTIYGKLGKTSALQYQFLQQFQTTLQIEEL